MGRREDETQRDDTRRGQSAPEPECQRVLLVDDNTDLVLMVALGLRREGYSVRTAGTGPDGLKAVQDWQPDIVLLDIGLPGMDGYEVARQLRADPGIHSPRLIALTGYARETDIAKSREAGFDAHLIKPFEFDDLLKVIGHG